ncbi:hypothetical protein WA158_004442 [Blastocystis sp. Blastoise]
MDLMSIIDTIRINRIDINNNKEINTLLDNLVYSHSIHIDEINPLLCNPDDIPDEHFCELYTTDSFHKLKLIKFQYKISDEHINSYKQQLIDSMFILENHVYS